MKREFAIYVEGQKPPVAYTADKPELLQALEGLMSLHEPEGRFQPSHYKPFLFAATIAIAKAKGEI